MFKNVCCRIVVLGKGLSNIYVCGFFLFLWNIRIQWYNDICLLVPVYITDTFIKTHILTKFQYMLKLKIKYTASSNNKIFNQVGPTWPIFQLGLDIIKSNILTRFQVAEAKMPSLECQKYIPLIWYCNLVYDRTWPIFELCLDSFKTSDNQSVNKIFLQFDLLT